jgi:two-component system, NarL family, sensor kinase
LFDRHIIENTAQLINFIYHTNHAPIIMTRNYFFKKYVCVLPLFFSSFIFAQTKIIDSAKKEVAFAKDNQKKLAAVFFLCDQYRSLNPDTLYTYLKLADTLSETNNIKNNQIKTSFYKSIYLINKAQLDSAEKLVDQTLATFSHADNMDTKNDFLLLKSRLLIKNNKQKESIENSLQILQSAESANDTLKQLRAKIMIGWAYMELDQNRKAMDWFLEAVNLDNISRQKYGQPTLYANMTSVYVNLHKYDSAELWAEYAVRLAKEKNDLTSLANSYFISAEIYIDNHNNTRAENLMQEGLKIRKLIGDPFYIVSDIYQLGNFYAHNNEPDKGITLVNEGISIAEKYNLNAKLPLLYTALAENYQSAGNYKMYSNTLNEIISLKDSMYTKNSADALSEIQTKYEVQKKQNIIIRQKLDLTKKNNLIYGTLILLAVTVLLSYVIFQTRKKNQQLKMQEIVIDQKRKTMDAVMQAEENERKRIAADLHDSVAQKMVVAKLNLEVLEGYLPALNQEQRHVYNNIFSLVDDSCIEVRNLSHTMMPQAFFQSGLTDAVKNFIDKIENKNLRVTFSAEGELESLDNNTEIMIYRVIQECLQNIIKHADASKVDISIILENEEIDVIIEDNGVGFDTGSLENIEGMGMKNLKSRIDFLNGELDINSQKGKGTVIAFYIPAKQS